MTENNDSSFQRILGIRFFVNSAEEAVQIGLRGGLVVVPAAPRWWTCNLTNIIAKPS